MKFCVFSNLEPEEDVSEEKVMATLVRTDGQVEKETFSLYSKMLAEIEKPSIDDKRELQIMAYFEKFV